MNEFYNKKLLELVDEKFNSFFSPTYNKRKYISLEDDELLEEMKEYPIIDDEVIRIIVQERYKCLPPTICNYYNESIEIKEREKRALCHRFIMEKIQCDILFEDFYKEYKEYCRKEEKEEYILPESELKKELREVGIGVSIFYNENCEPEEYITLRPLYK